MLEIMRLLPAVCPAALCQSSYDGVPHHIIPHVLIAFEYPLCMPCKSIQRRCDKPQPKTMTSKAIPKFASSCPEAQCRDMSSWQSLAFLQWYHAARAHHALPRAKVGIKKGMAGQLCRKSPSCHMIQQAGTYPATLAWQSKTSQAARWLWKKSCTLHRSCLS